MLRAAAWHRADGAAAAAALLEGGVAVDGLFCFNDALALGAMHELQLRGVRVPDDIAVAGFDDIEDGRYATPALTTVSPGREEMAARAVELLVGRIEGDARTGAPVRIEVGFSLQVRASTRSGPDGPATGGPRRAG